MALDFTAVDFATGGGSICSIGAARVRDGQIVDTYYQLVNPGGKEISKYEYGRNGHVTTDMVHDAPTLEEAWPGFLKFIGEDELVSYNVPTDMVELTDLALFDHHMEDKVPDNLWFDCALFFIYGVPRRLDQHRPDIDKKTGLTSAMRVVLGEKKRKDQNNSCADAALIARITVQILHELGADSLIEGDKTMLDRNLDAEPACQGTYTDDMPEYAAERNQKLFDARFGGGFGWTRDQGFFRDDDPVDGDDIPANLQHELDAAGLGVQIRAIREELGLSLERASQLTGCSAERIRELELHRGLMDLDDMLSDYASDMRAYMEGVSMRISVLTETLEKIADDTAGGEQPALPLPYYADQENYDRMHPYEAGYPYELGNYVMRAVQRELMSRPDGMYVVLHYAD